MLIIVETGERGPSTAVDYLRRERAGQGLMQFFSLQVPSDRAWKLNESYYCQFSKIQKGCTWLSIIIDGFLYNKRM